MVRVLGISSFGINNFKDISIYDPACGTGGMLTIAENYIKNELQLENSKFKIHILFEENYVNMIIICSFENRKKLIEILRKHCKFSIVEI